MRWLLLLLITACGLQVFGTEADPPPIVGAEDGGAPADVTPKLEEERAGDIPDAGGVLDGTLAFRCDAGAFDCRGVCVTECKRGCADAEVECVGCDDLGPRCGAVCVVQARCSCTGPRDCPGPRQTCSAGKCTGCGEPGSDGLDCSGGRRCDDDNTGNPNDNRTCR